MDLISLLVAAEEAGDRLSGHHREQPSAPSFSMSSGAPSRTPRRRC
jgi:hypothetical protein